MDKVVQKFGLKELEDYINSVGFKKGDVRTIKGVLSICNIPNTVCKEITAACETYLKSIENNRNFVARVAQDEEKAEVTLKETIASLKTVRENQKSEAQAKVMGALVEVNDLTKSIGRLENLLKKFS